MGNTKLQEFNDRIIQIIDDVILLMENYERFKIIKYLPECVLTRSDIYNISDFIESIQKKIKYSRQVILNILLHCGINLFVLLNKLYLQHYHCYHEIKLIECIRSLWLFIKALDIDTLALLAGIEITTERLLQCNKLELIPLIFYNIETIIFTICFLPKLIYDDYYPAIDKYQSMYNLDRLDIIAIEVIILNSISLYVEVNEYFDKMLEIFHISIMIENNTLNYLDLQHNIFNQHYHPSFVCP